MNWITILGIVVTAIGTLLMLYGGALSANKDKKEITEKIDSFNEHIEKIRTENIPASKKTEAIDKIDNEFNTWAEQFTENKEDKKIAFDKNEVSLRERKAKLNNEWRHLYADLFKSLSQMVLALNKAHGKNQIVLKSNPPLPKNIYDANEDNYQVVVQFKENLFWTIRLKVSEPVRSDDIPAIEINVSDKEMNSGMGFGDLVLAPYPEYKWILVQTQRTFKKADIQERYPLESKEIKEILKKVFEYQILLNEK